LIINVTLLRVRKDFVCTGDFLELFRGLMVARVLIGVVFERAESVGLLDLSVTGIGSNT
jgi:hypothetical protein